MLEDKLEITRCPLCKANAEAIPSIFKDGGYFHCYECGYNWGMSPWKIKPKKPIQLLSGSENDYYNCPHCNGYLYSSPKLSHCHHCGQPIDWSENEMNRLTVRLPENPSYLIDNDLVVLSDEFGAKCWIGDAVERLADYEDTRLTPDEVVELKENYLALSRKLSISKIHTMDAIGSINQAINKLKEKNALFVYDEKSNTIMVETPEELKYYRFIAGINE